MATIYLVDGGSRTVAVAEEYMSMLTKYFPLIIHAQTWMMAQTKIREVVTSSSDHKALVVVGEELNTQLFSNFLEAHPMMHVCIIVFVVERSKCPDVWDAFKHAFDPPMSLRYLSGEE